MSAWQRVPKTCVICGKYSNEGGHTLPLCHVHTQAWQDSPERAEAATARARFILRIQAEAKKGKKP